MNKAPSPVGEILAQLEAHYGPVEPNWPVEPYQFLVWWHCGYPASDVACDKGWQSLQEEVGVAPERLLAASLAKLSKALKPGGLVPELRAQRLKELATRVQQEYGGDLRAALQAAPDRAAAILKKFPGISDAGAARILLFAGLSPVAAVPSNCTQVLVRILRGKPSEKYDVTYRQAAQAIEAQVPPSCAARTRAYLLLKHHGQELCKRTNPKCPQCPVRARCAFFADLSPSVVSP